MVSLSLLLTVTCASFVGLLLYAERTSRRGLKRIAKPLASACFVGVGIAGIVLNAIGRFETLLLTGLVLGMIGDVALLSESQRAFVVGLGAFLIGHVAYVIAFATFASPANWSPFAVAAMTVFGASVLVWLWPSLGAMRVPVVLYVATICTMVVAALAVYAQGAPSALLIALGAGLFAVSDLAVARERFVSDSFLNKAWGLPAYYAGQLMLAWAANP